MQLIPDFNDFAAAYEAGENQVVYARLAADLDTPVSLMLKLAGAAENAFMLESVTGGEVRGRYSIVGMKPDLIWRCHGETSEINRSARFDPAGYVAQEGNPLDNLRALIGESRIDLPADLPQAAAGLFGYLGYDTVRLVEHLPNVPPDPMGLPDAVMLRPSVVAVLDGVKGEVIVVAPAWVSDGLSARAAYAQAAERVMDAIRDLDRAIPGESREMGEADREAEPVSNFTPEGYRAAVETAKEYIRAGDIFQVVPSQRWAQPFRLPPFALYRSLRRTNPSPFMFYFNFGGFQVIGASPEILVRVFGREVTIRPIAGTRPRGATPDEDRALEADLLADKKELAEHLMLLDLGRNDVGRVAKIGTVRPTEKFIIERYSHVMHIVSNVIGELDPGKDAVDAFFAGMPAGTVSGAPKVRAMEIIDELEPEKRGVYGGGVGYFSAGGDMDMCIALRTAVLKDETLYIQAGGGIVYDSDPQAEFEETVHKSNAIRRAAADAGRFDRGNRQGGLSARVRAVSRLSVQRAAHGDRGRAVIARMGGASRLDEAQPREGGVVFNQLHPGLQLERRQAAHAGADRGVLDQPPCQPLPPGLRRDRQLAQVERIGLRRQDHAGVGRGADGPDLALGCRPRQIRNGQAMHRGRRIDPALHIGETFADELQDPRQAGIGFAHLPRGRVLRFAVHASPCSAPMPCMPPQESPMPQPWTYRHASKEYRAFLDDVKAQMDLTSDNMAYTAVDGVLQCFRRRLTAQQGLDFANVLPSVLRAIFIAGWQLDAPHPWADRAALTAEARALRRDHNLTPENAIEATAFALRRCTRAQDLDRVLDTIGPEAQAFWHVEVDDPAILAQRII